MTKAKIHDIIINLKIRISSIIQTLLKHGINVMNIIHTHM